MIDKRPQTPFVAWLICVALTTQIALPGQAAVPIEESVGNTRDGVSSSEPPASTPITVQPERRAAQRELDIPPTIEPTVNTDYNGVEASPQTSGSTVQPIANANRGATNVSRPSVDGGGGSQLRELFYQLQVLQQEIQDLRGQVEEQTYLVNRLQRDQKEQYLDLDRRMVAMSQNQPAPGPSSTPPSNVSLPATGGALSERETYSQAFEAMKGRQFDASMAGFQTLIETYPNGQYTPNAYYWIGELHLVAKADPELARQSFMQVVNLYPDHQKTPDALYKLGVVYHNLGDIQTSLQYLNRVQSEHPASPAAGLAAKYAAELQ